MQELINLLTKQLGIDAGQAAGGAGLLFKLAQSRLGGDFNVLAAALPEVANLINQAPASGGAAKLLGGLASSLGGKNAGDLASLAAGFSKLNLDPAMIQKFVPVVLGFLKTKLGPETVDKLAAAIKGAA